MTKGFRLFAVLCCLTGLCLGGFSGLIIVACLVGSLWWFTIARARLAVRAHVFLIEVEFGNNVDAANKMASSVGVDAAASLSQTCMRHAALHGGQLALISLARQQGFRG